MSRGRPPSLENLAARILAGSCIGASNRPARIEIGYRNNSAAYVGEFIRQNGKLRTVAGTARIAATVETSSPRESLPTAQAETQNGMPFAGYVEMDGMQIAFYGSAEAYARLKNQ